MSFGYLKQGYVTSASVMVFSVVMGLTALPAIAQVGPMPPREMPQAENANFEALKKFFKKDENEAGEVKKSAPVAPMRGSANNSDETNRRIKEEADASEAAKTSTDALSEEQQEILLQEALRKALQESAEDPDAPKEAPRRTGRPPLLTQPPLTGAQVEKMAPDPVNPPVQKVKLDDPTNPLGLHRAITDLHKAHRLISSSELPEARELLVPLRLWLVDATEAHIGLYRTLNKLPSAKAQAELEKQLALDFARLRDKSMMELGRLYVAEINYPKAVKELTEVVKSQPNSKMGVEAYELLQQIGFTEKIILGQ